MKPRRIINEIFLVLGLSLVGLLFFLVMYLITDNDFKQEFLDSGGSMLWILIDYITCCLFTAVITFYYWKSRERVEKDRDRYRLMVLDNQLSPHFVLNNLSILANLIEIDQKKATDFLMSLSKLYRHTLTHIDNKTVPIKDELDFLNSYTALLEKRFENCIKVDISPEMEQLNGEIPPATLQLLIENAIKHNEHTQAHPLTVSISSDGDYIAVSNTKRLISNAKKGNVGHKNIIERYKLLTSKPVRFNDSDKQYCVTIPIISKRK